MIFGTNEDIPVTIVAKKNKVLCKKNETFVDSSFELVRRKSIMQSEINDYEELTVNQYIKKYMNATGKTYIEVVEEIETAKRGNLDIE